MSSKLVFLPVAIPVACTFSSTLPVASKLLNHWQEMSLCLSQGQMASADLKPRKATPWLLHCLLSLLTHMDSTSLDPGSPPSSLCNKLYAEAFLAGIVTRKYKATWEEFPLCCQQLMVSVDSSAATSTFGFMASMAGSGDTPFVFPISYHVGLWENTTGREPSQS